MNVEEFNIKVPWGHLAVKAWGVRTNPVVLTFHGIMDNAGSFDRLIPLLPRNFRYACIDLLGHGKSSHSPPFMPYHSVDNLLVYKHAVRFFGQDKYIIMGHSYGAQIATTFAQLYPESVEKLILLDGVYLYPIDLPRLTRYVSKRIDKVIDLYDKSPEQPSYTRDEAIRFIQKSRRGDGYLCAEGAETLLERGMKSVGDEKLVFAHDPRIKHFLNPLRDIDSVVNVWKAFPLDCPVLAVLASENEIQRRVFRPVLDMWEKSGNYVVVIVDGSHDVHVNEPGLVASYVTRFLNGEVIEESHRTRKAKL